MIKIGLYKLAKKTDSKLSLLSYKENQIEISSLDYIQERKKESLSKHIQDICDLWSFKNLDEMLDELRRFSESFRTIEDDYIPESITDLIEIIFLIINSYYSEDPLNELISEENKHDYFIECITLLTQISSHGNLVSILPPCIYDLTCSHFIEFNSSSDLPDKYNIYIYYPDSIKMLLNLTSDNDTCQDVKKLLTIKNIREFYFNQDPIQKFYSNMNYTNSIKKICLKIFYNILNNSNVESPDFPSDIVLEFVESIINVSQNTRQLKWILNIIFLLCQNKITASKIMADDTFLTLVNFCLFENRLNKIYHKEKAITAIQIKSLQIFSLFLNIEGYDFEFDIGKVIELANNQRDHTLILTALETLQNFADCSKHSDLLIQLKILPILNERLSKGLNQMKKSAAKVLANLFYYTPVENFADLLNESLDDQLEYEILTDLLFEIDNSDFVYVALIGLYNFFNQIIKLGFDFLFMINETSIFDRLPQLFDQFEDDRINDTIDLLMSYINEQRTKKMQI